MRDFYTHRPGRRPAVADFVRAVLPACACAAVLLQSGCMQLTSGRPAGPWHDAYEPINDPESEAFVAAALEKAVQQFGEPALPVRKVMLRRSRKVREARRYRIGEDFSLTECVDSTNGVFVIYLAVDPGHRNYFPLLGHECAHLLDARIFDWYMEGAATLFSRQVCEETGREWGSWKRHFERTRRDPYGLSYRMMSELEQEFPEAYPSFIRCTAEQGGEGNTRLRIDIDAWLARLPPDRADRAREIIAGYADVLERNVSPQYYFRKPDE